MKVCYISTDGLKFDTEVECRMHEHDVAVSRSTSPYLPASHFYDSDLNEVELFTKNGLFNWAIEYMIIGTDAGAQAIKAECYKRRAYCPIDEAVHGRYYMDENGDAQSFDALETKYEAYRDVFKRLHEAEG